jgi:hypothetical protein
MTMTEQALKITRTPHLKTIKVGECRINSTAQREANANAISTLASHFNPDLMGIPVVSYRDGIYWIIDGQHRILALKQTLGEDADAWEFVAEVYQNISEEEEAALFLELNTRKPVKAFDRFKVGVTAGLPEPSDIERIVISHGLRVSQDGQQGSISAVGALESVYRKHGAKALASTLTIMSSAWDSTVWDAFLIRGIALFCNRYATRISQPRLIKRLSEYPYGVKGIKADSARTKRSLGTNQDVATASIITNAYNKGLRGVNSLGDWFKDQQ